MKSLMRYKTVLITGSTDGIGRLTALGIARMGAKVFLHGRNAEKGRYVLEEIRHKSGNASIEFFSADLSSQQQVRALATDIKEKHDHLDVLINNAGVYMPDRKLTEDGLEITFAVNHLAHFLLTNLLLDLLKKSAPSRIITLASVAHQNAILDLDNLQGEKSYDGYQAYALSKLACVLFTYELAERLEGTKVTANCLHPGVVDTKMLRAGWPGAFGIDPERGADAPVYLASSQEVEKKSGLYFDKKRTIDSSPLSRDPKVKKKFWEICEQLVGIKV